MTERRRRQAGFTLIELMIVITILGIMAYMVAPRLIGVMGKAKPKIAATDIANLGTALDLFYLDVGRYPTEEEGLRALYKRPDNLPQWAGPYLQKPVPNDPWGRPYGYKYPGEHSTYDLWTFGASGQPGGEGENRTVCNWE